MAEPVLTRRRFLAAAGALAATPALAGCGGTPPPPATIRAHLRLSAYERAFFARAILPPFERARGVRVELADGTTDEAIGALYADRSRFDLLAVDTEILGALIADGLASDVSGERDALGPPIVPSVLGALGRDGRLHALPYRPTTWVTFANSALLGAAGVATPGTWDELLALAGRLPGEVALQGAEWPPAAQSLTELIWAFGGDPFAPAGPGALAAGLFLARLAPLLAPESRVAKFDTLTRDLATDRVALGPNWPVVATDLLQRGGKAEIAASPALAGPAGRARVLSGQVLIVPAGAPAREGGLALAAHLRRAETQRLLARELAWFPAREDAVEAAPAWQRPVAAVAADALRAARALPPLADREAFDRALGAAFRQIAFEGAAPEAALTTAAARLQGLR